MANITARRGAEAEAELGRPVHVYTQGGASRVVSAILCPAFIVLAAGLGYWALAVYPQEYPHVARTNVPIILVFAAGILAAALYWAWRIVRHWNDKAVAYEQGLAHMSGGQLHKLRWDEIESLQMRVIRHTVYGIIPAGTEHKYTITGRLGDRIKLDDNIGKVEQLFDEIRERAVPHILARSRQAFDAGAPVQFGAVSISKAQGLQYGKKRYGWDEIAQVRVVNGLLMIKTRKGGLFSGLNVAVPNLTNLDVLLTIVSDVAAQYAGQAAGRSSTTPVS